METVLEMPEIDIPWENQSAIVEGMTHQKRQIVHQFVSNYRDLKASWCPTRLDHLDWLDYYYKRLGAIDNFRLMVPEIRATMTSQDIQRKLNEVSPNCWEQFFLQVIEKYHKGVPCADCGTNIPINRLDGFKRCTDCKHKLSKRLAECRKARRHHAKLLRRK